MRKFLFGIMALIILTGCSGYSLTSVATSTNYSQGLQHLQPVTTQVAEQDTEGENIHIFEGLKPLDERRLVLRVSAAQLVEAGIEIRDLSGKEFVFMEKKGNYTTPSRIIAGEKEIIPSMLWAKIWVNENLDWYFKKLGEPTSFQVENIYWVNMKHCQDNNWRCTIFEGTEIKEIDGIEFVSYPTEQYPILITNP